ncbi:MAG: YMGG-like glycine zipper-containing protein [Elstera sp.]
MKTLAMTAALSLVLLSACGNNPKDRALSGAGIGAAAGTVGGLMVGSPVTGAVVGGAVGAGVGGLTKKEDLNLGKPLWK